MANESTLNKLYQVLQAEHVEIIDNSWMHAGHVAMAGVPVAEGTHLQVTVVSPLFEGMSRLDRHRMIHQALQEEFAGHLHALEIKAYAPAESPR